VQFPDVVVNLGLVGQQTPPQLAASPIPSPQQWGGSGVQPAAAEQPPGGSV